MEDPWEKVTYLRKPKTSAKESRSESAVNRAMASGAPIEVTRKSNNYVHAGTNKQAETSSKVSRLAEETDVVKVEKISLDVAKAIQKARCELGWSQKELATKINQKEGVINDYEAGRAAPNNTILGNLERHLGIKLRGSNIGSKLDTKQKK